VTGPKFFAEALAEYEDAVVYYESREEGLGARLIQDSTKLSPSRSSTRRPSPPCRRCR
jgi:hypothetical protein